MTKKSSLTRISINLPSSLVEQVREYAEQLEINYTDAYIYLLRQGLKNNMPFADQNEYETNLIDLISENLIQNDKLVNKLYDMLNEEKEGGSSIKIEK